MTLTLLINAILCLAVITAVVAPLLWAIRTAHRDAPAGHHDTGRTTTRDRRPITPASRAARTLPAH